VALSRGAGREPVLALRALGLGDALTAVPALRALRRGLPGRPLLLAASGPPAALLKACGVVDGVVPTSGLDDEPPGLGLGPHLAVNLHGRGPESHRLLLAGSPTELLAFEQPSLGVAGPAWDADEHEVLRWCRLARVVGPRAWATPEDLRLSGAALSSRARSGPVVLHPGAASGSRRWPPERFAAVARALTASRSLAGRPTASARVAVQRRPASAAGGRLRAVVTGSAGEAALCREVVGRAGLPAASDLSGRLDLPALARLLSSARLLVCGDTGVAHLATALGTPSVLLFGPMPPARWGPLVDEARHRVIWHGSPDDAPGNPHGERPDPTLLRIDVAEVVAAARALLGAPSPGPLARHHRLGVTA
jgi:ADP-heptose:LPS heptosyltransferase